MDESLETLLETPGALTHLVIEFAPRLLSALLVLVAGYFVMRWVAQLAGRGLNRFPVEQPIRDLLLRLVRLGVLFVFLLIALQNLGIELLPLIAGLGIAGAGIALAMQGVLSNVAAGLTIIFTRPFHVGQYVSIAGEEGEVREVSLFSTTLRHSDLSLVVVPNRKIAGEILHNYGEIRQLNLSVSVAYAADLDAAIGAIRAVLAANPRVLKDPAPLVQTALLGDYAVSIAIKPWVAVRDFGAAPGEINPAVLHALRELGLEVPVPALRVATTVAAK